MKRNRRRKKRFTKRAEAGAALLIIIIILIITAVVRIDHAVRPVAQLQAKHYSKITANKIISSAVGDYLEENRYTYSDFAAVLYDADGKAVSIEAVTYNINKVQSELTEKINTAFEQSGSSSAEIPIGSLTDSYMLAGKGPHLRLRICPAREASVSLTSSFSSAGMNQTCHRISVMVTTDINSSLPLYSFNTETDFEFLLAENIIVGEVPENAINVWEDIHKS